MYNLCTKLKDLEYFPRAALRCGEPEKDLREGKKYWQTANTDAAGKCGATCMPDLIKCPNECGPDHPNADGDCNVRVDMTAWVDTKDAQGVLHRKYDNDSVERCRKEDNGNRSHRRECQSAVPTARHRQLLLICVISRKERENSR